MSKKRIMYALFLVFKIHMSGFLFLLNTLYGLLPQLLKPFVASQWTFNAAHNVIQKLPNVAIKSYADGNKKAKRHILLAIFHHALITGAVTSQLSQLSLLQQYIHYLTRCRQLVLLYHCPSKSLAYHRCKSHHHCHAAYQEFYPIRQKL